MAQCCGQNRESPCGAASAQDPGQWFGNMLNNCFQYAQAAKAAGRPVVGIMCEYCPRELIMAAGAVPVCMCGGSAKTIPPAEEHLPVNLCPLIKSTYGYHIQRSNPFLEMADLIVGETTCDGKKKMYELMAETRPMYVMELPQKPDDPDALEHWVLELRKFKGVLESRFGAQITECRIREAIGVMNRERKLRRDLAALMQSDNPPMTGRQLMDFKSSISGIPADLEQYEKALARFRDGVGGRFAGDCPDFRRNPGTALSWPVVGENGTVPFAPPPIRVLMTGVPMATGAERVLEIIEDHGGLVVCMENCTGVKPILEDVDADTPDPIRTLAEKYFRLPCPVMTHNRRRLDVLRALARDYRAECIIELIWQACLIYDVESYHIRRLAEQELKLPYLRIETDYWPSDSARIALRVEALMETVRAKGTGFHLQSGTRDEYH